jgi:polyphosphate kinase 2
MVMTQPEELETRPTLFTRMFGATRYVMTLAVLAVFVGATVLLLDGIFEMGSAVWHRIIETQSNVTDSVSLRVAVIEAVDVILVATVLYVISFGLYQPLSRKEFEEQLEPLPGRAGQAARVGEGDRRQGLCGKGLFEGRDAAGKGGIIKRITERTSPRVFRVVALPSPTEREKSQMYFQRYMPHLPAAGEVVLFDRSWYNRAGVERVMGFASEEQVEYFLQYTPLVEQAIINSGIILVKYWLEVSMENQTERFTERIEDYRKIWKLSPMDLESHRRWYDYSRARDAMFAATDTPRIPWYVVDSNDQRRARLNCIAHLLEPDPLRRGAAREGEAAQAPAKRQLCGARLSISAVSRLNTERSRQCQNQPRTNRPGMRCRWQVAKQLQVDPAKGLSASEAQQRLQQYGPNVLAAKKKEPGWQAFLRQYKDFMQIILLGAAVLNYIHRQGCAHDDRAVAPDGLQRRDGLAPGIQGRSQPGRAREDDEEHRPRAARRPGDRDRGRTTGAGRHRADGGGQPRPGRWPLCSSRPHWRSRKRR